MIAGINEPKLLTEHISCKWECKFDGRKCNPNQIWNVSVKIRKNIMCAKKATFGILLHVVVKMVNV